MRLPKTCFFSKSVLAAYPDAVNYWGCIMLSELRVDKQILRMPSMARTKQAGLCRCAKRGQTFEALVGTRKLLVRCDRWFPYVNKVCLIIDSIWIGVPWVLEA